MLVCFVQATGCSCVFFLEDAPQIRTTLILWTTSLIPKIRCIPSHPSSTQSEVSRGHDPAGGQGVGAAAVAADCAAAGPRHAAGGDPGGRHPVETGGLRSTLGRNMGELFSE